MKALQHTFLFFGLLSVIWAPAQAQESQQSDLSRDERMEWWRNAKFGMFVHWGVYSVTGGEYKGQKLPNSAEWMMNRGRIPIAEYEEYAAQFNPTDFDAAEFVGLAKQAGMKYLVITAKHHDGFSMFGSHSSNYNIVDATPFQRDIMKELAEECQKQGLRLGFYYSQAQDWHHPGGKGNSWDKSLRRASNDEYVREKAVPEVKQLLTEYGPIGIFWWDTPRSMSRESFDSLHSLTKLQPNVITNDRLGEDYPGDYKTFERKIPAQAPAGRDWEVCMPISGSWGYKRGDNSFKSPETLIQNLVDIVSKGGNYLLNVSPTGKGILLPEAVERLKLVGEWMDANSESIYGAAPSPLLKLEWGRCTSKSSDKGTVLYLHVFDWPQDGKLFVPGLYNKVKWAHVLATGDSVASKDVGNGVELSLPENAPDKYASVIKVQVSGTVDPATQLPAPDGNGVLVLEAVHAYLHNNEGSNDIQVRTHQGVSHIGYWTDPQAWIEWNVDIDKPGEYEVTGAISVAAGDTRFTIGNSGRQTTCRAHSTGGYGDYEEQVLGTISIDQPGQGSIQVKPLPDQWNPMNLRTLTLRRK